MNANDILIALGVVGGVALILGILLAVISKFFAVEEDQKVVAVRACLPGVNCGACGYKGCDDYAAAVAEGTAKPNLCVPGAEATAQELSEILGVEVEAPKDVIAFVHCNGTCDAASNKAVYDGVATCMAHSTMCRFACDSGLWHQIQCNGHPFKKTVVLIPGPSSVQKRWIFRIVPIIIYDAPFVK